MGSYYAVQHDKVTKLFNLAALIPPSTAEVERLFCLMKPICTKLRKRQTNEIYHLMRICKYTGEMNDKVDLKLKKGQQRKDVLTVDYTDIFIFLSIYLQLDFQNVSSFSHCCCLILFIICFYCRLHHSFSFLLFLILYRKKRY